MLQYVLGVVVLLLFVDGVARFFRWYEDKKLRSQALKDVNEFVNKVGNTKVKSEWNGKNFLVLVNPYSGWQRGVWIYEHVVKPMFDKADIKSTMIVTKRSGHAQELLSDQSFDLSPFHAIIIVSGDGLFHEVLNGLWNRFRNETHDTREVTNDDEYELNDEEKEFAAFLQKYPMGLVTAGSSNGLAASIGVLDAFSATKRIIEGKNKRIDLLRVVSCDKQNANKKKLLWDCCALSWAIVSEHDEWQEHRLRFLPTEIRNLLAPLIVICQHKKHLAKLEFVPVPLTKEAREEGLYTDPEVLPNSESPMFQHSQDIKAISSEMMLLAMTNMSWGATDCLLGPTLKLDEGAFDILVIKKASRLQLLRCFITMASGSYLKLPFVDHYKCTHAILDPASGTGRMFMSGERVPYGQIHLKSRKQMGSFIL